MLHKIPKDLKKVFDLNLEMKLAWKDITPLAKNEWICWVISAKRVETRNRRIIIMKKELLEGKRRPCCFAGCSHRIN